MERKFKCTVQAMLIAAATAVRNLEINLSAFAKDYPLWTLDWLRELLSNISELGEIIGIKASEKQREATLLIKKLQSGSIADGSVVKNQIIRGFRSSEGEADELLNLLGFTKCWAKANHNNQNAMVEFLNTFNNHTDTAMVKKLTDGGVSLARIASLKNSAHTLAEASVTQETLKSTAPAITAEMNISLNMLYETIMDICSAGKVVFRKDPVRKAQFSFAKLVAQQASSQKTKPETAESGETKSEE